MGDLRHLGCNDETGCSRSLKRTIFSRRASNVPSNSIPPDRIDSHSSIARTNRSNRGRRGGPPLHQLQPSVFTSPPNFLRLG